MGNYRVRNKEIPAGDFQVIFDKNKNNFKKKSDPQGKNK